MPAGRGEGSSGEGEIESHFARFQAIKAEWAEIVSALKVASLCGMGTGLAEFAQSIQRHYGEELESWFA